MYCPSVIPCRAKSTRSSSRFMGTSASARHATAASNCTQQRVRFSKACKQTVLQRHSGRGWQSDDDFQEIVISPARQIDKVPDKCTQCGSCCCKASWCIALPIVVRMTMPNLSFQCRHFLPCCVWQRSATIGNNQAPRKRGKSGTCETFNLATSATATVIRYYILCTHRRACSSCRDGFSGDQLKQRQTQHPKKPRREKKRTSWGAKACSAASTARMSASRRAGTLRQMLQVAAMPMSSMTAGADVVPTTSSRRPLGGCFFSSTNSVCACQGRH